MRWFLVLKILKTKFISIWSFSSKLSFNFSLSQITLFISSYYKFTRYDEIIKIDEKIIKFEKIIKISILTMMCNCRESLLSNKIVNIPNQLKNSLRVSLLINSSNFVHKSNKSNLS